MQGLDLFASHAWRPFQFLGLTHNFFDINSYTIIGTWVALGLILIISLIGRFFLAYPNSIGGYIALSLVKSFMNLIEQSLGKFNYHYFLFFTSLFTFILMCNWAGLIPLIEEPTRDLNTAFALGIISFIYIQKESIFKNGIWGHIKKFFSPFILMFPLNILGEIAAIVSLSFRLFGNIFGGSVIMSIFNYAIAGSWLGNIIVTIIPVNIAVMVFFIIFEGFLQAFVFSILSLTNLSMAVQEEDGEDNI